MSRSDDYDAIVIGAGLAGSTAAYHLALRGYRVLLLEREGQPHHKVCGEFLSPETLPLLSEMGVNIEALGAVPITEAGLHSRRFYHKVPFDAPAASLSRLRLDEALLQRASEVGAELRRGVAVTHFEFSPEKQSYRVEAAKTFGSRALFLATGKHELKSAPVRQGRERSALGFKLHLKLSEEARRRLDGKVELFFYRGGYAGLCAVEEGRANLCLILDKEIFKKVGGDFPAVLQYLQKENPSLQDYLREARPEWSKPLSIANLPYGHVHRPEKSLARTETAEKTYLLGDQLAVIPSFTGSGMAIALWSGRQAAEDFHRVQGGEKTRYDSFAEKFLSPVMALAYPLHGCLRSPWLADACVGLLKICPPLATYGLRKTRIFRREEKKRP